jgi:hypothetical protein
MSWLDFLPDISLPDHIDLDIINIGPEVERDYVEGDQIQSDYAIKSEGNVIPVNEIDRIVPGPLPGDTPIEFDNQKNELRIDPKNLEDQNEWEDVVKPGLKAGWKDEGAVSTRKAYPILLQAERNLTDEKISDIIDFFAGKIFSSDHQLLQSSLTLDQAMNAPEGEKISNEDLKNRKRRLADKYHDAAYSLPSMCTSGYFDEDQLFREVYQQMSQDDEYDVDNYDIVFRKLIVNKPFVAYARDNLSSEELTDIIRGKISRLPQYDIPLPYVDVRGIGRSNHEKIRDAMDDLTEEYSDLQYDEKVGDGELIVRIDGDSLQEAR